jgi:hypothetical protein
MTTQLSIEFRQSPVDAVRRVLNSGPMRSLSILIALWHDFTWEEVRSGIETLMKSNEAEIVGIYAPPDCAEFRRVIDEIYGLKGGT